MAKALQATLTSLLQNVISWSPYSSNYLPSSPPQQIKLPDLITAFPNACHDFRINSLCKDISETSEKWARNEIIIGVVDRRSNEEDDHELDVSSSSSSPSIDLKTGLLASMCFPTVDKAQLGLCADFLTWVGLLEYHLVASCTPNHARDCIQECMILAENEPGSTKISDAGFSKGLQSILNCLERSPESSYVYDRFREAVHAYLQLLSHHLVNPPTAGSSQRLRNYVANQRSSGWHIPLFTLIEYAHGLKSISSSLQKNTAIKSARDVGSEAIIYALDIFACAGSFSHLGTPTFSSVNSLTLLAQEKNIDVSQAVERIGSLCINRLRSFSTLHSKLLEENSKSANSISNLNSEIKIYVRGLGDCIRGVLYWAFETERYFGRDGAYVRMTLVVEPTSDNRSERVGDAEE